MFYLLDGERDFVGQRFVMGLALVLGSTAFAAPAASSANAYQLTTKLLNSPAKLFVNNKGLTEFDKTAWSVEKQSDGTELYTFKKNPLVKAAVLRSSNGALESITSYKLDPSEEAGTLFYNSGKLQAYTSCEDRKNIGRVCVTTTPKLCDAMKSHDVSSDVMKEMDTFEMKSLSYLLNLRGSEHQLDNMAKSGNRLGLKTALQTTQGQLLRLAKQIKKEMSRSTASEPEKMSKEDAAEDSLAHTVIERSLPKLMAACADTGFSKD